MEVFKKFTFDSAHFITEVPEGHKCRNVHGHTYHLTVFFDGPLDPKLGWVIDFAEIKAVVKPFVDQLDHKLLNDIKGLENPTSEGISMWLWDRIKSKLPTLSRIELNETPTSGVVYRGEFSTKSLHD